MTLRVKDVQRSNPVTVNTRTTVGDLNRVLDEHKISGAPVLDDAGDLVGVVSQSDIVKLISTDLREAPGFYHYSLPHSVQLTELGRDICERTVGELMERRVHTVATDNDVATAARIMRNLHIHRVLVLEEGRLVGILTAWDLLKVLTDSQLFTEFYGSST